mmetsp:Transcript_5947/g.16612  ORF Transcript_5947/g.16612 Transcript_5947/m.16612 type:complete len:212 (-) Transcript_5947:534-1169(-)
MCGLVNSAAIVLYAYVLFAGSNPPDDALLPFIFSGDGICSYSSDMFFGGIVNLGRLSVDCGRFTAGEAEPRFGLRRNLSEFHGDLAFFFSLSSPFTSTMGTRLVASSSPSSMASASSASSASSTPWPPRQNANELTSVVPSTSPHPSSRSNCKPRLAELGRPFETPPASHAAHTPSPSERYHAFSASRLPNSRFSTSNASTVNLPCRTKGF